MELVVVDTTGIQPYIFGSNRLRENVGASYLVARATEDWALQAVREVVRASSNVGSDNALDGAVTIEGNSLDAEVLYAGGGNVVVLFKEQCQAKAFSRKLSTRVLAEAPNLQLVLTRPSGVEWGSCVLAQKVQERRAQLAVEKQCRAPSVPLLGLGVTMPCQSTGLPAVGVTERIANEPGYPASAEVLAKRAVEPDAHARLSTAFPVVGKSGYLFPRELDELGRDAGEHSYIAVVHADGNGIGKRIGEIAESYETLSKNREYVSAIRDFSEKLKQASQQALSATLETLLDAVADGSISHPTLPGLSVDLGYEKASGARFLPIRPVVFGGDDVTFVCDGRLGLSLATEYLAQFQAATENLPGGGGATACAGIAIVKSHYPFARAYALAEDLCKSAKRYRARRGLDGSCLDWHFATGGLAGDLAEIRGREYVVRDRVLCLRPVSLDANPAAGDELRAWLAVAQGVESFQSDEWWGRRNKMKALREALRAGGTEVKRFVEMYRLGSLPALGTAGNYTTEGWQDTRCAYFDALELADWHIPLDRRSGK